MNANLLFVVVPATFLILGDGAANAGQTIDKVGAIACVTDKWTETELEQGHKLAENSVQRCALLPTDPSAEKATHELRGKVMSTCLTAAGRAVGPAPTPIRAATKYPKLGRRGLSCKEYIFKFTGGTGKFEGASGGGAYFYESLTDTLAGWRLQGQVGPALGSRQMNSRQGCPTTRLSILESIGFCSRPKDFRAACRTMSAV